MTTHTKHRDTEKRSVKYIYSQKELTEMGQELASLNQQKDQIEKEAKSVAKQYSAQVATKEAEITQKSQLITDGYQLRSVEHEILWHTPVEGKKTFVRIDTGEKVVETMDQSDWTLFNQREEDEQETTVDDTEQEPSVVSEPGKVIKLPKGKNDKPEKKEKSTRKKKGDISGMLPAGDEPSEDGPGTTIINGPNGELTDDQMQELSLDE